jgi:hypothetical protein
MKTELVNTYCYPDFITSDEQFFLKMWALTNEHKLRPNSAGPNRRFNRLDNLGKLPGIFDYIRQRIIKAENIENPIEAPQNGDWIGIQRDEAFVEPHMDYNGEDPNFYTRRYNVLVNMPESGGQPIYDNQILDIKERTMWRCDAGLIVHSSVPNVGERPRINISYGFLMPK